MGNELYHETLQALIEFGALGIMLLLSVGFIFYSYRQHSKERESYREDLKDLQKEHRTERGEWRNSQKEQAEYVVKEITKISAIIMHDRTRDQ